MNLYWQYEDQEKGLYSFWTELYTTDGGQTWEVRTLTSHPDSDKFCPLYAVWQRCQECEELTKCSGRRVIDRVGAEALLHVLGIQPRVLDTPDNVDINLTDRGGPICPVYPCHERWHEPAEWEVSASCAETN